MCLSTVRVKKGSWKTGYKMALFGNDKAYYAPFKGTLYGRVGDVCQCDSRNVIKADDGNEYPAGIHIFKTLQGIRAYFEDSYADAIILQVEYKDVVASGTENTYYDGRTRECPVDVAKTMKIVKTLGRGSRLKWDELINKTRNARARK